MFGKPKYYLKAGKIILKGPLAHQVGKALFEGAMRSEVIRRLPIEVLKKMK